jgi:TPR repeat protein
MIKKLTLLFFIASFLPGLVQATDCISGLKVYVDGDYAKAADMFRSVAQKGDACAQFQLGMMYFYGHGVVKDAKKSEEWIRKSADNGFKKAKLRLAWQKK